MNEITARALVTGGSGGIGGAICRALSAQGHFVYVHAHRGMVAAQSIAAGHRRRRADKRGPFNSI